VFQYLCGLLKIVIAYIEIGRMKMGVVDMMDRIIFSGVVWNDFFVEKG
jgi:hypothetical protein